MMMMISYSYRTSPWRRDHDPPSAELRRRRPLAHRWSWKLPVCSSHCPLTLSIPTQNSRSN